MTMESVSKAAHEMIEEVRRQFHEDAGILKRNLPVRIMLPVFLFPPMQP